MRSRYAVRVNTLMGPYSASRYIAACIQAGENAAGEARSIVVFDKPIKKNRLEETLHTHTNGPFMIGKYVTHPIARKAGFREYNYSADSLGVAFPYEDRELVCRLVKDVMDRFGVNEALIKEKKRGTMITIRRKLFPCPVCGKRTLGGEPYDICPECGWEDEPEFIFGMDENGNSLANGCNIEDYRKEYLALKKENPAYTWAGKFTQ